MAQAKDERIEKKLTAYTSKQSAVLCNALISSVIVESPDPRVNQQNANQSSWLGSIPPLSPSAPLEHRKSPKQLVEETFVPTSPNKL